MDKYLQAHLRHDRFSGKIIPCQPRYAYVISPINISQNIRRHRSCLGDSIGFSIEDSIRRTLPWSSRFSSFCWEFTKRPWCPAAWKKVKDVDLPKPWEEHPKDGDDLDSYFILFQVGCHCHHGYHGDQSFPRRRSTVGLAGTRRRSLRQRGVSWRN